MGEKVVEIRVDEELWKRAKKAVAEDNTLLIKLVEDALGIVIGWRDIINNANLDVNEETLEKMLKASLRGEKPLIIVAEKPAEEIVR